MKTTNDIKNYPLTLSVFLTPNTSRASGNVLVEDGSKNDLYNIQAVKNMLVIKQQNNGTIVPSANNQNKLIDKLIVT